MTSDGLLDLCRGHCVNLDRSRLPNHLTPYRVERVLPLYPAHSPLAGAYLRSAPPLSVA